MCIKHGAKVEYKRCRRVKDALIIPNEEEYARYMAHIAILTKNLLLSRVLDQNLIRLL